MNNSIKLSTFLLLVLSALVVSPAGVRSQALQEATSFIPEAEREFLDAMKMFQGEHFDSASAVFSHIITMYPRCQRITGAFIMGAKSFYELKDYRESIRLLKNLIDLYPQSVYIADARYSLALNYFRTGRYEDATSECLQVLQQSQEKPLRARSEKLADLLTSTYLTLPELQRLQSDAKNPESKSLLSFRIAEKYLQMGDIALASEMLHQIALQPPAIKSVRDALALLEKMENRVGMKIGVVLPLMLKAESAAGRAMGVEFLQGIQLAVDEYNQMVPVKISLEVRDTERDPSLAARHVAELCSDEKITAIIGPVSNNEVLASAGIANERGVPLVTPTATANGISAIGPFIFQANPDYDIRGRDAAAFAYYSLGARTFAILAPTDVVGKQMVESFMDEVRVLGGELINIQWYAPGSVDLRTELYTMRRRALERLEVPTIDFSSKMRQSELMKFIRWGVGQRILDSLIERGLTAPVTFLFGKRGKQIADSLKIPMHIEHMKYDSLGLPVQSIDALFVPIASTDEIPIVSSQIKYFNFQAQILGTDDWGDVAALDMNRQYTDGVMFFTDSSPEKAHESYTTFDAKFRLANNNNAPGTNALYGYDVAKMILHIFSQGATRRKDIAGALAKIEGYEGLHSQISLSKNRVNTCMSVLQYKGRQILHIGKIDLATIGK
jgi:ABC-type branched-subunit amino acid transport system substrate-binding protein